MFGRVGIGAGRTNIAQLMNVVVYTRSPMHMYFRRLFNPLMGKKKKRNVGQRHCGFFSGHAGER